MELVVRSSRPLLGPYHLFIYGMVGDRPVLQALLLAALNAAVAVTMWRVGQRILSPRAALVAAMFFAVVPNRASTRMWFPTGNYLLAALIVLVGWQLLCTDRRRAAATAFAAAVLLFEGVIGLALAGATLWALPSLRQRFWKAVLVVTPAVFAAASVYLLSPKRSDGQTPNIAGSLSTLGHGLLGSGLVGDNPLEVLVPMIVLGLCLLASVSALPSLETWLRPFGDLRTELVLTSLTTAPFVGAGLSFAVRGIFDRTNAIPMITMAFLVAAGATIPSRAFSRVGTAMLALAALYLFALNLSDVDDYATAAREGRTVLQRVETDLRMVGSTTIVMPPLGDGRGVAAFVYPGDLDAAVRLTASTSAGPRLMPWSQAQCERLFTTQRDAIGYDWRRREIVRDVGDLCER